MKSTPLASFSCLVLCAATALSAQNIGLTLVNGTTNDYLDVPYAPTVLPSTGLTLEAWVTYDDLTLPSGYRWPTVARQNATPGQESYFLRVQAANTNAKVLNFTVRTPAGNRSANWSFTSGQLTAWTHVAGTYDGTAVRMYINGALVASTAATGAIVNNGGELRIGCGDLSGAIENWHGQIDEVRLWPFARTAGEIAASMNQELSSVPGEVSTWNLNGNGVDSSGTNNGAAVNSPQFATNTLSLAPWPFTAINYGQGTAGCQGTPRIVATTLVRVGNADFGLGSLRGTATGAGILWLGTSALSPPVRVFGIDLLIDSTLPNVLVSIPGGTLAFTRVPLPIPAVNSLRNRTLVAQMIWTEATCATQLFSTDGIQFTIAP